MEYEFAERVINLIIKNILSKSSKSEWGKNLVSLSIEEATEKSAKEIAKFFEVKQDELRNVLSSKSMKKMHINPENTAYVAAEIRSLLTQTEDKIDDLVRRSGHNADALENFLWREYTKDPHKPIENMNDVKKCLNAVAQTLIKIRYESEDFHNETLLKSYNDIKDLKESLTPLIEKSDKAYDNNERLGKNAQPQETTSVSEEPAILNNKKGDYIKIWNSSLFLNTPESENPMTLKNAFIMPDFSLMFAVKEIGITQEDSLKQVICKFISYPKTSTMLITGVPGIGKSSITAWIANQYCDYGGLIILKFRDWQREELNNGLMNAIQATLNCPKKYLEEKVLILEGFDEIKAIDEGNQLLSSFRSDLLDFHNLKCIITSRPAYIKSAKIFSNVLQLKVFDIERIKQFYGKILGKELLHADKIQSNLDVLGIPVILYLALMSDVEIDANPTKPELYNRIFAESGGIFDKFWDGQNQYSEGSQLLRDPDNTRKYLSFLSEVAKKMYEKGDPVLNKAEAEIPKLRFQNKEVNFFDFPIKHLFEETTSMIEFVHRSIYEYFLSEYFCNKLRDMISTSATSEILAGKLGEWLISQPDLSIDEREFLRYKVHSTLMDHYKAISDAFYVMMQDGMTCFMKGSRQNMLEQERLLFSKMLNLLHLWGRRAYEFRSKNLPVFLWKNDSYELNLTDADLHDIHLENINLFKADFSGAILTNANLSGANLKESIFEGARMQHAVLEDVNFTGAILRNADLSHAKIHDANLTHAILYRAKLDDAILNNAILRKADLRYLKTTNSTTWKNASLFEADLRNADLRGCDLRFTNLRGANLDCAKLSWSHLNGVDFNKAIFSPTTELISADISGAIFDEEQLDILKQIYNLKGVQIYVRTARGIELLC